MPDQYSYFALRAELYQALAEALAEPPWWIKLPGKTWPLFDVLAQLARSSEAARHAVGKVAEVRGEAMEKRRARYKALFSGPGRPQFWIYESMHLGNRLIGPQAYAVESIYRTAGLAPAGGERPDHASVELAFLAHLAAKQASEADRRDSWQRLERLFIQKHAGRWLPAVGRELSRTGDPVYAPIGRLMADWLEEAAHMRAGVPKASPYLPMLRNPEECTLCGFCAQVCPTGALAIYETRDETSLFLSVSKCVSCRKCEYICENRAIQMACVAESRVRTEAAVPAAGQDGDWRELRNSPRIGCPVCGQPTVSRAELDFVATQIGPYQWLEHCVDCR